MPTPHDYLFKELLSEFSHDFLQLFVPELAAQLEPGSLILRDKEHYPGLKRTSGRVSDLLLEARIRHQHAVIVLLLEHESQSRTGFPYRLFDYFARLLDGKKRLVYPIVVYSYSRPRKRASQQLRLRVVDLEVIRFSYRVVQLNQLLWRDFLHCPNPTAAALMARMQIAHSDRPRVKAECLRLLTTLHLDPRKSGLIAKFVDSYLELDDREEAIFDQQLEEWGATVKQEVQQYVTTWERRALQRGLQQGLAEGINAVLAGKFGDLSGPLQSRVTECRDLQLLRELSQHLGSGRGLAELEGLLPQ